MHAVRALLGGLFGSNRARTRDVVGNMIVGNVTGMVIQQVGFGPPPEPPSLPWRDLQPMGRDANEAEVFTQLSWKSRLVETLVGRDADRESLLTWARDGRPLAIRLLSGPGGASKSRLSAEIVQQLRNEGWAAGFVALERETSWSIARSGILLVIDYPEAHRDTVRRFLHRAATLEQLQAPVRLLLASRQSFDFWFDDIAEAGAAELCDSYTITVGALTADDTVLLVRRASERLAGLCAISTPVLDNHEVRAWHGRNPALHGLPLFATAAALHAVLDSTPTFELAGVEIVAALVRRERARLDRAARAAGWRVAAAASRLHGLAVLRGGLDEAAVMRLAREAPDLGAPVAERVIDALRAQGWWHEGRLPQIQPDLVAAELLHQILAERPDAAPRWLTLVLEG